MEEFLNKLYNYEYFGTYLMISIIVLLILFIVILFLGKKDKTKREIEATKKLQQINNDAFKEDSVSAPLEANPVNETEAQKLENDTIIVPSIDEIPTINNLAENTTEMNEIPDPILPSAEPIPEVNNNINNNNEFLANQEMLNLNLENNNAPINMELPKESGIIEENKEIEIPVTEPTINIEPTIEPQNNIDITPVSEPIFAKEEEKPLVFNNDTNEVTDTITFDEVSIPEIDFGKPEPTIIPEVEVPTYSFEQLEREPENKEVTPISKGPEIFSSVYVPEKEESSSESKAQSTIIKDDDIEIELPALKKEVNEEKKEEPQIETPEVEKPILTDYKLDELAGETYTIDK